MKSVNLDVDFPKWDVAPFAGAWIEIAYIILFVNIAGVAPFAGAWIEIKGIITR